MIYSSTIYCRTIKHNYKFQVTIIIYIILYRIQTDTTTNSTYHADVQTKKDIRLAVGTYNCKQICNSMLLVPSAWRHASTVRSHSRHSGHSGHIHGCHGSLVPSLPTGRTGLSRPTKKGLGYTKETGNRNAIAISENCYQPELSNGNAVFSICAGPFNNMCSTQADHSSRKMRLRCGCQFPPCSIGQMVGIRWVACCVTVASFLRVPLAKWSASVTGE
jgi:hypothetical protein